MTDDYPVFRAWYSLLDWILDRCEKLPRSVRFSLSSRIAGLGMDVLESLIEAIYARDRREILDGANLDIEKLRVLFRICHDRRYISVAQYEHVAARLLEVGRMIGGWRKHEAGRSPV